MAMGLHGKTFNFGIRSSTVADQVKSTEGSSSSSCRIRSDHSWMVIGLTFRAKGRLEAITICKTAMPVLS